MLKQSFFIPCFTCPSSTPLGLLVQLLPDYTSLTPPHLVALQVGSSPDAQTDRTKRLPDGPEGFEGNPC